MKQRCLLNIYINLSLVKIQENINDNPLRKEPKLFDNFK